MGIDGKAKGLNNPTSGPALGIAVSAASEIIEPPAGQLGTAMSLEGLNNPTSEHSLDIAIDSASEIIEPPAQ